MPVMMDVQPFEDVVIRIVSEHPALDLFVVLKEPRDFETLEVEKVSAEEYSASMPLISRTGPVRPPSEYRSLTRISINPNWSSSRSIFPDQVLLNRKNIGSATKVNKICLLYTSPSPRDRTRYRMPSSA